MPDRQKEDGIKNMNVSIHGSRNFNDYSIFIRAMGVILSDMRQGGNLILYTLGPLNINNHASEFFNKTSERLRRQGVSMKLIRSKESPQGVDKHLYFCNNGERLPRQLAELELDGVDVLVFRF